MDEVEVADAEARGVEECSLRLARWGGWFFPLAAALGVGLGLFVSLWVGAWKIERSVVVHAESVAISGAPYPVRVALQDVGSNPSPIDRVELRYERGDGSVLSLGELSPLGAGFSGTHGATLKFPEIDDSDGELVVLVHPKDHEMMRWGVPVAVRSSRPSRAGSPLTNESKLALTDDSDPQPEALKIDVQVMGQMMAPFTNVFMVRLTGDDGSPLERDLRVLLVSGIFDDVHGSADALPLVFQGTSDAAGLARFKGRVQTEVVRFKVEVDGREDTLLEASRAGHGAPHLRHSGDDSKSPRTVDDATTRVVRLVGYPGAAKLTVARRAVLASGSTTELRLAQIGLRSMVIDIHDATGAWIDTIVQPKGSGLSHEWQVPIGSSSGVISFEAYRRSTSSRAGATVELLHVGPSTASRVELERALLRRAQTAARSSSSSSEDDRRREIGWIDTVEQHVGRGATTNWLEWTMGTMTRSVYGAPVALRTLPTDDAELLERKNKIHGYVRNYLIVGGALYLMLFALWLLADFKLRGSGLTAEEAGALRDAAPSTAEVIGRFSIMLVAVAGTLALIIMLFDNLIWSYH